MEDKVKRYFVACDPYVAWSLMIQVDSEGEWVKHRDHAAALASAQAEIARLRELVDTIALHDRSTTYEYGEKLRDGTKPGVGQRFLTPRELVKEHHRRAALTPAAPEVET